jgi:hypothetical protein
LSATGNILSRFGQSITSASQIIVWSFKPVTGGYYYCLFGKAVKVTYQDRSLNLFDYLLIMAFAFMAMARLKKYSIRNEV